MGHSSYKRIIKINNLALMFTISCIQSAMTFPAEGAIEKKYDDFANICVITSKTEHSPFHSIYFLSFHKN